MAGVKLKRFLLRYDPPGIGLELQEDKEELRVVHKDMPPSDTVSSGAEIFALVDNLIESESFLTRRRHRAALVQLLGRLYQVDTEGLSEDDKESPSGAKIGETARRDEAAANSSFQPPASPEFAIQEGMQVVLLALKGKLQEHNGQLANVVKAKKDKDKYEVLLMRGSDNYGDPLKIKGSEHMVPVAKGVSLSVGTHVAIRGLRNHVELNGCLGRVVECHEESHRFEVRATESGQLFRVKQENLVPIEAMFIPVGASKENREPNSGRAGGDNRLKKDASGGPASSGMGGVGAESTASLAAASGAHDGFDNKPGGGEDGGDVFELGSTVQLVGLKTAMCYNGQCAEVMSVDRVRCRYEIRLNDGSVKTIRAENVRLVSGPAKQSPRTRRKDGAAKKPAP